MTVESITHRGPEAHRTSNLTGWVLTIVAVSYSVGNLVPPQLLGPFVDIYLVLAIATIGFVAFHSLASGRVSSFPWYFFVLGILGYARIPDAYGSLKIISLAVVAALFLAAPLLWSSMQDIRRMLTAWFVVAAGSSLFTAFGAAVPGNLRLASLDQNPIAAGRLAGLAILLCLVHLIFSRPLRLPLFLSGVALAGLLTYILAATGSRGPAWALVGSLAVTVMLSRNFRAGSILIASIIAAAAVPSLISGTEPLGGSRILTLDDSGRAALTRATLAVIREHPLGLGWGGLQSALPQYSVAGEIGLHPHNIFLEFAAEAGILGVIAVLLLLVQVVRRFVASKHHTNPLMLSVFAVFAYSLINAQFSSDIVGNRLLWLSAAMLIALSRVHDSGARDDQSRVAEHTE